jgi:catechol 2,3-dioxygenase-like lactoylglutathione lyase family enzyme
MLQLTKDSIDLGINVRDGEASLKFYRDTLGFEHVASIPLPGGGGTMHRLLCGTSLIKLNAMDEPPTAENPPGGPRTAIGVRYWTISVSNLEEIVEKCEAAGYTIPIPIREARPGVTITMVEDPDGNYVEFLRES